MNFLLQNPIECSSIFGVAVMLTTIICGWIRKEQDKI